MLKMKIAKPRILPPFPHYIRNIPIKDDQIMVSFDLTSLYKKIPIIDTLNIIEENSNNADQLTRETATPHNKFLDLVNLVLRTMLRF